MSITLEDFYKDYKEKYKDTEFHLEKKEYKRLVGLITDHIMDTVKKGRVVKFPLNLGQFYIYKRLQKHKPIDWYNTKKYGKVIRHFNFQTDGYVYRFGWDKRKARFTNKTLYEFKVLRKHSRSLKPLIDQGKLTIFKKW